MALILAINKVSQSADAASLIIDDTTGSGAGGWGNGGNPAYTTITSSNIRVFLPNNDVPVSLPFDSTAGQALANPAGGGTFTLTTINLGLNTEAVALPDGVYTLEYIVMLGSLTVEATNGDKTITGTGFTTTFANTEVIEIDGVVYFIDKSTGFTDTTLELTQNYAGSTGSKTAHVAYMDVQDILVYQNMVNRVQCAMSHIDACCGCDTKTLDYLMHYAMLMGAKSKEACGDFQGAQTIMDIAIIDLDISPCGC